MKFSLHSSVERYRHLFLEQGVQNTLGQVFISYWGANSLVISDQETTLLVDPHFSRLPRGALFSRQGPNRGTISRYLDVAGIDHADAVLLTHTHYDHAMDAPYVASRTGAQLVGAPSAEMVGRGNGLPEECMTVVESGHTVSFGSFKITFLSSGHVPLPFPFSLGAGINEAITSPVMLPSRPWDYKEGGTYNLHIAHSFGSMVISGSAGWSHGGLQGWGADVVFLVAGGLALRGDDYMRTYFDETVSKVRAKTVLVTHWDDFTRPLDRPLRLGGLRGKNLETLLSYANEEKNCTLHLMPVGEVISPFEHLGGN